MNIGLIRHLVGRILPHGLKKRFRKMRSTMQSQKRHQARETAIALYGVFDADELISVLRTAGICESATLFVQSSCNDLHTFSGGPLDVLHALRSTVGAKGTLLMPAYTNNTSVNPPRPFDVMKEPTFNGIINELFRRSPCVMRSLHPRHSICGEGRLAQELLEGHEKCVRADGPDSPYDRLWQRKDAYILTLGLPQAYVSFLHWIEDIEPDRLPFQVHKSKPVKCMVRDLTGQELIVFDYRIKSTVRATMCYSRIGKLLSPNAMRTCHHKGISIYLYPVNTLAAELIALRNRGIIHYEKAF